MADECVNRGGPRDSAERARFDDLFSGSYSRVYAYVSRRVTNQGEVDDIVAETFLVVWRRFGDVPEGDPLPWVLAAARKVLANSRRSERRRQASLARSTVDIAPASSDTGFEDGIAEREAFLEAFYKLSERDREVLCLVAWEGFSVKEAATAMGCTSAVFSVRLYRARRRLERALVASGRKLETKTMSCKRIEEML